MSLYIILNMILTIITYMNNMKVIGL